MSFLFKKCKNLHFEISYILQTKYFYQIKIVMLIIIQVINLLILTLITVF